MLVGYARVSTEGQSLDAQVQELRAAGCVTIRHETASGGARTDRKQLARVLREVGPGDVLVVTRLDRLARSVRDLLNVLHEVGERGAGFRSLADAWADTTTAHGRLMLTVIGGIAEFERELIRARTGAGRERARTNGVKFGPKFKLTPYQAREVVERHGAGETETALARSYGVNQSTINRLLARSRT
jgi:DNA invertase Pin-like site-specific DNA recombinase